MIMGIEVHVHKPSQVYGCGGGHGKPIAHLWALYFLDTRHQDIWLHTGHRFLAQSLGRRRSLLLLLSTKTMVLEGSMPANVSYFGHLSLGAMSVGFLRGL